MDLALIWVSNSCNHFLLFLPLFYSIIRNHKRSIAIGFFANANALWITIIIMSTVMLIKGKIWFWITIIQKNIEKNPFHKFIPLLLWLKLICSWERDGYPQFLHSWWAVISVIRTFKELQTIIKVLVRLIPTNSKKTIQYQ